VLGYRLVGTRLIPIEPTRDYGLVAAPAAHAFPSKSEAFLVPRLPASQLGNHLDKIAGVLGFRQGVVCADEGKRSTNSGDVSSTHDLDIHESTRRLF
jgi:hypothetical protein